MLQWQSSPLLGLAECVGLAGADGKITRWLEEALGLALADVLADADALALGLGELFLLLLGEGEVLAELLMVTGTSGFVGS